MNKQWKLMSINVHNLFKIVKNYLVYDGKKYGAQESKSLNSIYGEKNV